MYGSASTSTCARSLASTPVLRRVVGIYVDVFGREVAAPGLGPPLPQAERGRDLDLRLFERPSHCFQVDLDPGACGEHRQPGDADCEPVDGHLRAAVAEGTYDAAPVRVGAVDGRLDQAAGGNCSCRYAGLPVVGSAGHPDGYQLGRPLPVASDLAGQLARDLQDRLLQRLGLRAARLQRRVA